ncbi:MAG TPA: glycosyl hydrolase [Anaeromyxobacter sp.]|nr:glycosyl hydrolase [Anaeromyxobacter sp.]
MRTALLPILAALAVACSTTPRGPRTVDATPSNPEATAAARAVLAYLAAHSTGEFQGTVVGQNAGHGSQIADPANTLMGFDALVGDLHDGTGKWVGMVGVDYEHDLVFRPEQLAAANAVLSAHWERGGLVTINWAPQNPWLIDESDLSDGHQGVWTHTRNQGSNLADVNLDALVDPSSAIYPVWRRKLDRIATALAQLRDAGVVVLWRPMQEMNGDWFWWGYATYRNDGGPYQRVWQDMYRYFTEEKGLDNLLWVYSPADSGEKPAAQNYPGADYVDVVGPTYYGNALRPGRWVSHLEFGKPVGFAELGPNDRGDGSFDNRDYLQAIRERYPEAAYFVAWHDWDWGDGTTAHMSLTANEHAAELLADPGVITADELPGFE